MPSVQIKTGNGIPQSDGEINLYESPTLKGERCFDRSRRVIFVNGMLNSGKDHKESAEALSTVQCCPVIGLYNSSKGTIRDLGQCLADKVTFSGASASTFQAAVDAGYLLASAKNPSLSRRDWMISAIGLNKATKSLFALLSEPSIRDRKNHLFAHSQGNLITSNALFAMQYAFGIGSIQGWPVSSFGSPAVSWPSGLSRTDFTFTFDPVGWLNFVPRWSNVKVGGVVAHGFLTYIHHLAEFTVNKYRVKAGLTLNFDEEGLAKELVGWGANPLRIWGIFKFLLENASSDADDVAYYYVKRLKDTGRMDILRSMSSSKPNVIQMLTKCLGGGWVTGSEAELMSLLSRIRK